MRGVYLIHFDEPYKHARHYVGYADDIEARIARHRSGLGARLIAVIQRAGIGWSVVHTWPDADKAQERKIKRTSHVSRICPVCRAAKNTEGSLSENF